MEKLRIIYSISGGFPLSSLFVSERFESKIFAYVPKRLNVDRELNISFLRKTAISEYSYIRIVIVFYKSVTLHSQIAAQMKGSIMFALDRELRLNLSNQNKIL